MPSAAPRSHGTVATPDVVDLAQARGARRLRDLGRRCKAVDDAGRRALTRLFQGGAIFSRQGARLGRDLLLAHQHLLRAGTLVSRAMELEPVDAGESDALHREAAALVDRAAHIVARCEAVRTRG